MNIIESKENGEVRFARAPQSSIYPENIYLENNAGTAKKREVTYEDGEKEPVIQFDDIEKRKEILEKLLEIEREIEELQDSKSPEDQERLSQLYADRLMYLNELDITEKEAVQLQQEYDEYTRSGRRPRA